MSKIGLYIQNTTDPDIRAKLLALKPPVVLMHLDGGDLGEWIRSTLPEIMIIGRYYWAPEQQESLLYAPGTALADLVLGAKGGSACHAFMLFNEFLGSPVDNGGLPDFRAKAAKLDALQVEFRAALVKAGKEAVAWNFAAGNWPTAEHYREHFPLTLAAYRYLGFHVYGWPKLAVTDWRSNLAETMRICDGLPGHTCIVTEMAATRAYANQGQDVGWLSGPDPIAIEAYASDLSATAEELCKHPNVAGACLFNAAPDWRWQTFSAPHALVERLAAIPGCPQVQPEPKPPAPTRPDIRLRLPFDGDYPMTRTWGSHPEAYARFGLKGHEGVDWALPSGTPVLACADGVIYAVDTIAGDPAKDPYGVHVRVQHDGYLTVYAHLSKVLVSKGQRVKAGDRIGLSGNTGNSTGPHLHLSFRWDGANRKDGYGGYSDPVPYLVHSPPGQSEAIGLLDQAVALVNRARELIKA